MNAMKTPAKKQNSKLRVPPAPPAAATVMAAKYREEDIPEGGPWELPGSPPPLKDTIQMAVEKFCPEVEPDAPDWAKRAREQVVCSLMPPCRTRRPSEDYLNGFGCGELSGAASLLPAELTTIPNILNDVWSRWALKLPAEQRAEFFIGARDGERRMAGLRDKADSLASRAKVFLAIAQNWRKVATFGSDDELWTWLKSLHDASGKPAIVDHAYREPHRELRKIRAKIGLSYRPPRNKC